MIPGVEEEDVDVSIDDAEIERLLAVTPESVSSAPELSFARNVFVPLTTACRYTCTYCTYFDPPGEASLLSLAEVRKICRRGADAGCTEALFTFGDDPDDRYTEIHARLAEWGYDSIHDYLRAACEVALEEGLLPHANPGDQTRKEMAAVADVNASMGTMLETTAEVDAHAGPRRKEPGQRLRTIKNAGELAVPFTTGILVGIGESPRDRAESLLAIADLHDRYDHVQEVIVQPVVENERWHGGTPDLETLRHATAMARAALPPAVSVQVPPNLAPARELVDCGIDDLGGVSPVTDDHVNPDYAWPELCELEAVAETAGVPLRERLPVYERYLPSALRPADFEGPPADGVDDGSREWIRDPIRQALSADDDAGTRYRTVLEARNS
ncbi:7,8-didemethyl-8-hydroxy-5-deazariboflavin synthase subunit CofG [Natrialbaceae archaeon AArc-T1-2]|uniref:7,8-didemethyl-8-hydroxy-5-deazariboflavin synthase subunit CofG n=1 Tax=Natrialbaceae archaeon AArc-T1-2 TaxID=3053904 RepID=UPI00255AA485|nr:7,8-didemethyl-8-hydroxy-5-deazariboflavin synthase subunit CofG [Natrialbaceae archaeon AArc-T1-2]WIV67915.1 7,8-didemethyl-8-hydroxy-5-deazariboflavin synthase subunit CofG [Natrialbaceae archaeon AArc-T1-2]